MANPPDERCPAVETVLVVIPARNEEERILDCLAHLEETIEFLRSVHPVITVNVHMVLDACTDSTETLATTEFGDRQWLHLHVDRLANVGMARGLGVLRALDNSKPDPRSTLLAFTDADSRVPLHWLASMVGYLESGSDAILGTVRPDSVGLKASIHQAWRTSYTSEDGHRHVHGANLGVRASTYLAVGGFPPLESDEDVHLVRRLASSGARISRSGSLCVLTSSRLVGRAPKGFAAFLGSLHSVAHPSIDP